jgi:hypothetical protein
MPEVSDTDGKTYVVQYFERAVFELHTEFAPPNDVLLSLLGVFLYNQKYPAGAPNQSANTEAGSRLFPETGKHVGGLFLRYWTEHGGLAQQGYPISEEFQEVSDLNGQTYKVQYFQRAVFEFHPEQAPPFNVLLSQLGTFRYRQKYLSPPATATPVPALPTNTPVPQAPTNTPVPAATNTPTGPTCDATSRDGTADPKVVRPGTVVRFTATGFAPNENASFWFTLPDQSVFGTASPLCCAGPDGTVRFNPLILPASFFQYPGTWALTVQGQSSNHVSVIFFCVVP